jgi:hypothetical protein
MRGNVFSHGVMWCYMLLQVCDRPGLSLEDCLVILPCPVPVRVTRVLQECYNNVTRVHVSDAMNHHLRG